MPLSVLGALWGIEYLVSVTHGTKDQAAGAASMMYVGWLVAGPIIGWYSDKTGLRRKPLLIAGLATLTTTIVIVSIPSISVTGAYILMFVLGLASCSQVVCFVVTMEHNPISVAGTSIAATNMMIMLLGGISEWLFGLLLDWFSGGHVGDSMPSEAAFRKAVLLLPVVSLVGLTAAFLLKENPALRKKMPAGPESMR
jgi:MFS family permease